MFSEIDSVMSSSENPQQCPQILCPIIVVSLCILPTSYVVERASMLVSNLSLLSPQEQFLQV